MRVWSMGLIAVLTLSSAGGAGDLPQLPDSEGFAGSFAGVSNGALVVAGGANFPEKRPWQGGKKVWTDRIFVLTKPTASWQMAGKLSRPLGYGVSVSHRRGVVCVGGSDARRHYADAFRLEWHAGTLKTTRLPPLPGPLAHACGALVGDVLYIAGGQEKPDAPQTSKAVFRIDLSAGRPQWERIEPCPGGGRMLAVAVGYQGAFWLLSGVDLSLDKDGQTRRKYLKDAYRYDPAKGWSRIADLPWPVAAAPSPAPVDASGFYVLGGDDGSQVGSAPDRHRGFRKTVLRYDSKASRWIQAGTLPAPRVTAPCVAWGTSWIVPSGEVRPGVRSPRVIIFTPTK